MKPSTFLLLCMLDLSTATSQQRGLHTRDASAISRNEAIRHLNFPYPTRFEALVRTKRIGNEYYVTDKSFEAEFASPNICRSWPSAHAGLICSLSNGSLPTPFIPISNSIMTRSLSSLLLLTTLSYFAMAQTFTNQTIDDTIGVTPVYVPPGAWQASYCPTCAINPNSSLAHGGTWHSTTCESQGEVSMQFSFTGMHTSCLHHTFF